MITTQHLLFWYSYCISTSFFLMQIWVLANTIDDILRLCCCLKIGWAFRAQSWSFCFYCLIVLFAYYEAMVYIWHCLVLSFYIVAITLTLVGVGETHFVYFVLLPLLYNMLIFIYYYFRCFVFLLLAYFCYFLVFR